MRCLSLRRCASSDYCGNPCGQQRSRSGDSSRRCNTRHAVPERRGLELRYGTPPTLTRQLLSSRDSSASSRRRPCPKHRTPSSSPPLARPSGTPEMRQLSRRISLLKVTAVRPAITLPASNWTTRSRRAVPRPTPSTPGAKLLLSGKSRNRLCANADHRRGLPFVPLGRPASLQQPGGEPPLQPWPVWPPAPPRR